MSERWGSCTTADRTIRISDRLIGAPQYVLDYIIFHELIHLIIPGHDQNFYSYLNRFTDQCKAEAFLEGFELGSQSGGFSNVRWYIGRFGREDTPYTSIKSVVYVIQALAQKI